MDGELSHWVLWAELARLLEDSMESDSLDPSSSSSSKVSSQSLSSKAVQSNEQYWFTLVSYPCNGCTGLGGDSEILDICLMELMLIERLTGIFAPGFDSVWPKSPIGIGIGLDSCMGRSGAVIVGHV